MKQHTAFDIQATYPIKEGTKHAQYLSWPVFYFGPLVPVTSGTNQVSPQDIALFRPTALAVRKLEPLCAFGRLS